MQKEFHLQSKPHYNQETFEKKGLRGGGKQCRAFVFLPRPSRTRRSDDPWPVPLSRKDCARFPASSICFRWTAIREALAQHPRKLVLASIRHVLEEKRRELLDQPETALAVNLDPSHLAPLVLAHLEKISAYTLQSVVNATGIIVHTNLGRSLLAEEASERLQLICRTYSNLEYDLEQGRRGSRYVHAEAILCELTGAEAALVVNNNAAAVLLTLNTLAKGREVIVSRGQLVEIGGSFRIPDVMRSSGATLTGGRVHQPHAPAETMRRPSPTKPLCCCASTPAIIASSASPPRSRRKNW